jgi:hypothetical protein
MKKIIVIYIFIMFLTTGMISSATDLSKNDVNKDQESLNEKNYYAVLIGIEEFLGYPTPEEEYIDESVVDFYEQLLNSSNWYKENILLLLNENATKEKINDAITIWLAEKENEDDIVLILVCSHGWKTKLNTRIYGNAYFYTHNTTNWLYDKETKISDKDLDAMLDVLDSKHIAVILGHCYSGRMFAVRQSGRTLLAAGGKYLFCPCDHSIYLQDGIFDYFLKQGLDGVADINQDGWVTVREAYHYLRLPVIWYSMWYQFPYFFRKTNGRIGFMGPQIPYLYDRHVGEIPLIKYNEPNQTKNL